METIVEDVIYFFRSQSPLLFPGHIFAEESIQIGHFNGLITFDLETFTSFVFNLVKLYRQMSFNRSKLSGLVFDTF